MLNVQNTKLAEGNKLLCVYFYLDKYFLRPKHLNGLQLFPGNFVSYCSLASISRRRLSSCLLIASSRSFFSNVGRREYLLLAVRSNLTDLLVLFVDAVWYSVLPLEDIPLY